MKTLVGEESTKQIWSDARVHVVDDDPTVLGLIEEVIQSAGLTAVTHQQPESFLQQLEPDEFGCALLDLVMPELPGLSVLRRLHESHPTIPVLILSGHGNVTNALESVRNGAVDFVEKPFRPSELIERIMQALELARELRDDSLRVREIQDKIDGLTRRESELMPLLCGGMSVKEVAFKLGLSHKTVQIHRSRILSRMGVSSVVDLANLLHEYDARRQGSHMLPRSEDSDDEQSSSAGADS